MAAEEGGTMASLVAITFDGGDQVVMEVDDDPSDGVVRAARPGEILTVAGTTVDAALERLRPLARTIVGRLRALPEPPDEIAVEFGIKASLQAGMVVARSSADANFKVSLQWQKA
jgi:hypothetical protein